MHWSLRSIYCIVFESESTYTLKTLTTKSIHIPIAFILICLFYYYIILFHDQVISYHCNHNYLILYLRIHRPSWQLDRRENPERDDNSGGWDDDGEQVEHDQQDAYRRRPWFVEARGHVRKVQLQAVEDFERKVRGLLLPLRELLRESLSAEYLKEWRPCRLTCYYTFKKKKKLE